VGGGGGGAFSCHNEPTLSIHPPLPQPRPRPTTSHSAEKKPPPNMGTPHHPQLAKCSILHAPWDAAECVAAVRVASFSAVFAFCTPACASLAPLFYRAAPRAIEGCLRSLLACVERPGAPSNPMKMAEAGPPFLSMPRPRPLRRFRAWRCTQVPATATSPPPERRTSLPQVSP